MKRGRYSSAGLPVEDCEIKWNEPLAKLVAIQDWLDMSGRHLTEIPVASMRSENPQVSALNLDFNHLIDLPIELGQMASLVSISLNSQTAIPRASISKRPHLKKIPEIVGRLSELRMLLLRQNNIDRLPESLARTNVLCVLDLRLNNLQNFPEHVCSIRSLKQLFLSGNEICEIPEAVGELSHLEVLRIANNRLFRLPDSIGNLKRLRTLSLRKNQLHTLPRVVAGLSRLGAPRTDPDGQALDGLFLADNPWMYPPAEVVERGTQNVLEYLRNHEDPSTASTVTVNMSKHGLTELSQLPGSPEDIITIDARDNKLRELPTEATCLPNLTTLILDRNAITTMSASTLMKMGSVKVFSLQDQDETRDRLGYVQSLSVPTEIMMCDNLTELHLGRNHITSLPPSMVHLTRLRVLDLQVNSLREFPAKLCEGLLELQFLGLSSNSLEEIPSEIGCLTKLKVLRLSKNQLQELPETICRLTNLHTLSVRYNSLRYLPLDLHKLQRLSGHEEFRHVHMSFKADLKVGDNQQMKYPEKSICDEGTAAIFDYLRHLENNPHKKQTIIREIESLMGHRRRTSTHTPLTDRYLLQLAETLGHSWHRLAIYLGYTVSEIDAFVTKYPTDLQLQCHRMLVMWRDGSAQDETAQVHQLTDALKRINRQDLADAVPHRAKKG